MERSLEISPEIRAKEAKVDFAAARQRLAKNVPIPNRFQRYQCSRDGAGNRQPK